MFDFTSLHKILMNFVKAIISFISYIFGFGVNFRFVFLDKTLSDQENVKENKTLSDLENVNGILNEK